MSSAHEEIRDEGEERGIETVDGREICQEGKCHSWKEQKPFYNCRINHDHIQKITKTMLQSGANTAATTISQLVLHKSTREGRGLTDLGEPEWFLR